MKKYITLAALLAAGTACANAVDAGNTLLITFGSNTGTGVTTGIGSFLEVAGMTYNIVSTGSNGGWTTGQNALRYADNTEATSITFSTGQAVSGNDGKVTTITDSDKVGDVFDTSMMSSVINFDGGFTSTFSGLTNGKTYEIYAFAGRGNNYGGVADTDTNTYSISSGAKSIKAEIIDYTVSTAAYPIPDVDEVNNTITAYTQSNDGVAQTCENWVLMKYTFTANATTVKFTASGDGCGNLGAIALVNVPEPSAFGMLAGLGALALVASRRRRK